MDFLDVIFDFYNNLHKPYRKPNNKPIYINKQSNHHPNVLEQLPKSIAKIISDTSSSKDTFIFEINYQFRFAKTHLNKSRFKEELKYTPSDTRFEEKKRSKNKKEKNNMV